MCGRWDVWIVGCVDSGMWIVRCVDSGMCG